MHYNAPLNLLVQITCKFGGKFFVGSKKTSAHFTAVIAWGVGS